MVFNLQFWGPQENNGESGQPVFFLFRKSTPDCLPMEVCPLKKDKSVSARRYLVNKDFGWKIPVFVPQKHALAI